MSGGRDARTTYASSSSSSRRKSESRSPKARAVPQCSSTGRSASYFVRCSSDRCCSGATCASILDAMSSSCCSVCSCCGRYGSSVLAQKSRMERASAAFCIRSSTRFLYRNTRRRGSTKAVDRVTLASAAASLSSALSVDAWESKRCCASDLHCCAKSARTPEYPSGSRKLRIETCSISSYASHCFSTSARSLRRRCSSSTLSSSSSVTALRDAASCTISSCSFSTFSMRSDSSASFSLSHAAPRACFSSNPARMCESFVFSMSTNCFRRSRSRSLRWRCSRLRAWNSSPAAWMAQMLSPSSPRMAAASSSLSRIVARTRATFSSLVSARRDRSADASSHMSWSCSAATRSARGRSCAMSRRRSCVHSCS
mmetsp:Transcript_39163/g.121041  ORF Transcript_39163/g.121041 Transcript_39163/m.121041 type:complete len:370 (+) Transcript_39163:336-1445(+)